MLEELQIRNWVLIQRLTLRFESGLIVLSGETGAGKSILFGALSLLMGERADVSAIRQGSEECSVTGIFRVPPESAAARWLREHDFEPDDHNVIVRRTIKQTGRGSIYLQSVPITRALLVECMHLLVDIYGQHHHQFLRNPAYYQMMLDRHAGIETEVAQLSTLFSALHVQKGHYAKMEAGERERARRIEILQHEVKEIEEAQLKDEAEEERLLQEVRVLEQHEQLFEKLEKLRHLMGNPNHGIVISLREARNLLEQAASIDTTLSELTGRLNDLFYEIEDVSQHIGERLSIPNFSPERLDECNGRLSLLRRLKKRYGESIAEVMRYCEEAKQEILDSETWTDNRDEIKKEIAQKERELLEQAKQISESRTIEAKKMGANIEAILHKLGMEKARFAVQVTRKLKDGNPVCGSRGIDEVSFILVSNPGEPFKPLTNIASGGELSRIMLAIKSIAIDSDNIITSVFDEIDVGIGGEVAATVGDYLQRLAQARQVLCITHLASIAARADTHYMVKKMVHDDRTHTTVEKLPHEDRIHEIARMLAGDSGDDTARSHAKILLEKCARMR